MKKMPVCMLVIVLVMSIWLSEISFGQEEETNYGYGKVANVSGSSITISEVIYDEDTDEEIYKEATYTIAPDAELENISSIDVLETGREIDIEYVEKDGKKTITYIYVWECCCRFWPMCCYPYNITSFF